MNILIITPIFPPQIGGPARYTSELAVRLADKGHQVRVIYFGSENAPQNSHYTAERIDTSGNTLTRQLRLFQTLLEASRSADVFYVQGTIVVGVLSAVIAKLKNKRLILKFVGDEVWESARNSGVTDATLEDFYLQTLFPVIQRLHIVLHRIVLKSANTIVVPSLYLKSFIHSVHEIDISSIVQINNPVEIDVQKIQQEKSRKKEDVRENSQKTLLYVGRLVKWKHVDQIIEAFAIASKQQALQLVIVGDGPLRNSLEMRAKGLGLSVGVQNLEPLPVDVVFTGKLSKDETLQRISQADALILYSDYEGQSHTLIEALLCQTSIIASDIPPNKELSELSQASFQLVPLGQPSALAEAMLATLSSSKIDASIFSWKRHIEQLLQELC